MLATASHNESSLLVAFFLFLSHKKEGKQLTMKTLYVFLFFQHKKKGT